eukprot:1158335-Pelagomonas_calceolata.AAC.16
MQPRYRYSSANSSRMSGLWMLFGRINGWLMSCKDKNKDMHRCARSASGWYSQCHGYHVIAVRGHPYWPVREPAFYSAHSTS